MSSRITQELRLTPLQSYHSRLSNHPSYRQDERTVYGLYKPLQHSTTSVCSCHVLFDMHGIDACLFCCPSPKQGLAACGSLSIYQYQYLSIFVLIFQSAAHRWVPIKACFSRESHSEQSVEIQSQADWVSRQQKRHPPSNCCCLTILANSSEDHAEDSLLVVDPGCDNCAWLNSIYSLSHPFSSLM